MNERSPLLAWIERRFGLDLDGLGHAADLDRERADRRAVAGADDDAGPLEAS